LIKNLTIKYPDDYSPKKTRKSTNVPTINDQNTAATKKRKEKEELGF
jgi:hypothetical protein